MLYLRSTYLHLFKDCGSVIGDNDFSIWTDKHLVHSFWSQWCLQQASNCSSCKNVNLHTTNKFVNSNWYSFMFREKFATIKKIRSSINIWLMNFAIDHSEMFADSWINGWRDTYLMCLSTLDSLLLSLLPKDDERSARLVES